VIRRLTTHDAETLARLVAANREFLAPFDPIWADDFATVDGQRARVEAHAALYGIFDEDVLAGTVALSNVVRGPFLSANLGYWVAEARNGRGLATRAVSEIVKIAFTDLGLHRVEAGTLVENIASQRVLEKNGFARIGLAPRYLRIAGAWRDHILFQRTAED
jgi:ribosomal-protein-alanine N-acetyltransferase